MAKLFYEVDDSDLTCLKALGGFKGQYEDIRGIQTEISVTCLKTTRHACTRLVRGEYLTVTQRASHIQALGYDDMKLRLKAIKQALIFNIDDYSIVYSHVKFAYFYSFSLIYF